MKRIFSILLVTALLVGLLPLMSTVAVAESYATVTSTNGYGVRLREGPSKAYGVIGKYNVGTTVVVLQRGSEWSQLQIGSTTGWMMNRYLVYGVTGGTSTGSTGSSGTSAGANATVISDNGLRVWLRATAGGKRLFLNAVGTGVTVLERGNTWCKVSIGGTVGYMMTKYLSIGDKPSTTTTGTKVKGVEINYPSPVVMDTLVATPNPAEATVKYSWTVDGVVLGTEREFYVKTEYANKKIAVKVTGTGAYTGSASAKCEAVQISKSIKSVALSKSAPLVGDKLSAAIKPSSATVEYSWRVGGIEVSNDATYTVAQDDLGKLVQLKVTGIGGYVGSAACSASANVASDKAIQSVKISKASPVVGDTLSATVKPSGATVNIAWLVNGEKVSSTASYKVRDLDLGKKITVQVNGVEPYAGSAFATTGYVASAAVTEVKLNNTSPAVGDALRVTVKPSGASVSYSWKVVDNGKEKEISTSASLRLKAEYQVDGETVKVPGKVVKVYVTGTGIYSGKVSASTKAVGKTRTQKVTAVSLSNASPVFGDTITAKVTIIPTPETQKDKDEAKKIIENFSYIWTVDTETAETHGQTYEVVKSDIGKKIRVQVIGTDGYTGEAYSAYSNPVASTMDIKGVSIYNSTAKNNASSVSPEVGHVLRADVNPGAATVEYQWKVDGKAIANETGRTYTVKSTDKDKKITVQVKGTDRYKKEASATSARVVQLKPVKVNLTVTTPKAGIKPSYSVSGTDKQCKASVQWMEGNAAAELNVSGTFKPLTTYTAKITITPENGYSLMGAKIKVNGEDVALEGKTVKYTFGQTRAMTVTDYYLSGIERPTVGGDHDTDNVSNSQVEGTIVWKDNPNELVNYYEADIFLSAKYGYTLDKVPANAFKVAGADKVVYAAGSDVVTVRWNISHELSIRTDKEQVLLDGNHNSVVQCTAYLTNFEGDLKGHIKWAVVSSDADATVMNEDTGTLFVGMNETPGRSLTVRATVTIGTKEIVATKELPLVSGTDTDTQLKISFVKAPTPVTRADGKVYDGKYYYEAIVSNSAQGYKLYRVRGDERTELRNGVLDTAGITDETVVIRAIANEDPSVFCNTLVTIVDPPKTETKEPENAIMTLDLLAPEDAANNALPPADATAPEQQPEGETPADATAPEQQPEGETPADATAPEQQPEGETPADATIPEQQPDGQTPADATTPEQQPDGQTPADATAPEQQPDGQMPADATTPEQQPDRQTPADATAPEQQPEGETSTDATIPEQQPEGEAPAEPEVLDDLTVTITGEVTVQPSSEKAEEPVQEGIVIKDTQTGETVDIISDTPAEETSGQPESKQEEPKEEHPAATKEQKADTAKKSTATEKVSEEDELDSLEGDDLLGESVESTSGIKIVFTKKVAELKRGGSATFAVDVIGSENGVKWSVRRSKDSDGNAVSTITQDGKLTISKAETSDKLIVVATSVEDGTVRARLIVQVVNAATNNASSADPATTDPAATDAPSDGMQIVPGETENPETDLNGTEEIEPETEQFTPEQLEQINREIEQNALENSAANDL